MSFFKLNNPLLKDKITRRLKCKIINKKLFIKKDLSLNKNDNLYNQLKTKLSNNQDFKCRELITNSGKVELFYLKSMTDKALISEQIIKPILSTTYAFDFETLKNKILFTSDIEEIKKEDIVEKILKNHIIIAFNNKFLASDLEKFPLRVPSEPPTSPNIYGPREGFVEDISSNVSLIRKRLPNNNLVIKDFVVGKQTSTKVKVLYLKNIAKKEVVKEILKRIKAINIDGVIDSYYIAEFLKTKPDSMFEQVSYKEKPDIVVGKMLEGRVAIVVDGSPIVLTLPYMFFEDLQSSNDYYTNHIFVSVIRVIRAIAIIFAIIMPGLYLSVRLYSYGVLPLSYIIVIANSTKSLPFTPVVEMLFIILLFQILYEVSLRLPQYLGLATSIVGALVLGDTGVKAGLISPPGVIIVAVSIMAIYTVPSQHAQFTVLRLAFVILGSTLGIFGIISGIVYVINYINTLNAYDTPYLAPFAPKINNDLQDAMFKQPLYKMKNRPESIGSKNKVRIKRGKNNEQ